MSKGNMRIIVAGQPPTNFGFEHITCAYAIFTEARAAERAADAENEYLAAVLSDPYSGPYCGLRVFPARVVDVREGVLALSPPHPPGEICIVLADGFNNDHPAFAEVSRYGFHPKAVAEACRQVRAKYVPRHTLRYVGPLG